MSTSTPQIINLEECNEIALPLARLPKHPEQIVFTCGSCSSALDVAWSLASPPEGSGASQSRLQPWDSVLAAEQTAGRGQLRRDWYSPRGNIYAALCLPAGLQGTAASVQVGWLTVKALHEVLVSELPKEALSGLKLKWPNDIIWNRHKVGGILLEQKGDTLIAGIGLNLVHAPDKSLLRENYALPASCLRDHAKGNSFLFNLSGESLWLLLVSMMRFWYETKGSLPGGGITPATVEPELAFLGEIVRVCDCSDVLPARAEELFGHTASPDAALIGRVTGLGPGAELRLEASGSEVLISSGSICPL